MRASEKVLMGPDGRSIEGEERNHARVSETSRATTDARYLLRQFKNVGNYLRLLFIPDVYGLCKLYAVMGCLTTARSPLPASSFVRESSSSPPLRRGSLRSAPRYRRGSNSCVTSRAIDSISFINHVGNDFQFVRNFTVTKVNVNRI